MKKCFLLLSLFVISLIANQCFAQINDPLNQSSKAGVKWSTEQEEVITKKSKNEDKNEDKNKNEGEDKGKSENINSQKKIIKITNTNPDKISVELMSLIGNRASQYVEITIKFTNHDVNEKMSINNFVAYNEEGKEFTDYYPVSGVNTFTDVPVKASWKFGKMLPNKNSKIPAMSFRIGDCTIEMRDVVIDWR